MGVFVHSKAEIEDAQNQLAYSRIALVIYHEPVTTLVRIFAFPSTRERSRTQMGWVTTVLYFVY